MSKQQRHHNVPLSLGGRDKSCNTFKLPTDDHRLIHSTLDVTYSTVRRYRAVLNFDTFTPTLTTANAQAKIEAMFFARVRFIPKNHLQKLVLDKLREDTRDLFMTHKLRYPEHRPTGTLQDEVNEELEKRRLLYIHLVGGQPLV